MCVCLSVRACMCCPRAMCMPMCTCLHLNAMYYVFGCVCVYVSGVCVCVVCDVSSVHVCISLHICFTLSPSKFRTVGRVDFLLFSNLCGPKHVFKRPPPFSSLLPSPFSYCLLFGAQIFLTDFLENRRTMRSPNPEFFVRNAGRKMRIVKMQKQSEENRGKFFSKRANDSRISSWLLQYVVEKKRRTRK